MEVYNICSIIYRDNNSKIACSIFLFWKNTGGHMGRKSTKENKNIYQLSDRIDIKYPGKM